MEYLRKEVVETVIKLANACYPPEESEPKWVDPFHEKEIKDAFKPRPEREKLEKFIDDLSDEEKIELMPLMWLGRDGGNWDDLINHAKGEIYDAGRYITEKGPLASYLRRGLERIG